jgi:hypothetical protein
MRLDIARRVNNQVKRATTTPDATVAPSTASTTVLSDVMLLD